MSSIKPRIKILLAYSDYYNEIGFLSELNRKHYAKKHGYIISIVRIRGEEFNTSLKLHLITQNLNDCDWLFWTDVDSFIFNGTIGLEHLCTNKLVMTRHYSKISPYKNQLHAGNFLIQNDNEVRQYFYNINKYNGNTDFFKIAREEAYLTDLYYRNSEFQKIVDIVPIRTFCSLPPELEEKELYPSEGFNDASFIIHFPSFVNKERREMLFKKYYEVSLKNEGFL